MKKILTGFVLIIFILGWFLNQTPLRAQSSSLNGKEYTIEFQSSFFYHLLGKYLYSKNLTTVHLHFEEWFGIYWDTTIVIQPNGIVPIFIQNDWFDLSSINPKLIRITSSDSLFVIGSNYGAHSPTNIFTSLQYEAGVHIPKRHTGNQYIIPGVFQSTPHNIFIYPVDENISINFTLTANANDTLFPDIYYTDIFLHEDYIISNDHSYYWFAEFILDTLMHNSLAGTIVEVENCKQIRVQV